MWPLLLRVLLIIFCSHLWFGWWLAVDASVQHFRRVSQARRLWGTIYHSNCWPWWMWYKLVDMFLLVWVSPPDLSSFPDLAIVKETRNYNKWIIKNEMKNGSLSRMRRTRTTWPGSSLPVWHPLYEYDWQNCAATVHSPPLSRPTLLPLFSWAGYIYLPAFQWDCQWFMRDVELIPKVSPPSIRRNNIAPSCPFDEKKVTGQGLYSSSP